MEGFENLIQYNNDNTVNVPFGRVAEWYIINHPLLKNIRLKNPTNANYLRKKWRITGFRGRKNIRLFPSKTEWRKTIGTAGNI